MSRQIHIKVGDVRLRAELNDSATAGAIYDRLPIRAPANRWGDEIYFEIPVDEPLADDASEVVQVAELGYWPPGRAFCIFFGPTPASTGSDPRAASPVNRIGWVTDDVRTLTEVPQGAEVRLDRA
ncbi:MAG: hypothetical protein AMS18_13775 [Gemmatimonas sp. SG8_17]|nr:MAG: hypothetical protein AMS18_13775 [Gemmatimonas sp. SG8_17]